MATNLLKNGRFEADWGDESSHQCLIVPTDGSAPFEVVRGNIFTPPKWLTWFRHGMPVEHDPSNGNGWAQPEVRDAWVTGDPRRVREGLKAILLFTFFRIHDGGFLQQVQVQPGDRLRFQAWAHAWSNHKDTNNPQDFPHPDDSRWSEGQGVGYNHFFAPEGQVTDSAAKNFTFYVGIDPTGGTNPFASTVVWGKGAHIYNAYRHVPSVEAVAVSGTVTVFLRSKALWPFKHCDAYWDDAVLEVVTPATQTTITFEPAQPQEDERVEVSVASNHAHTGVGLTVKGPGGGGVPVTEIAMTQPAEGGAWKWAFAPDAGGDYHVAFTAGGGAETPAEATLVVTSKPAEVWGLPRAQYARTYVLMPPGAGRAWVEAVLDSGAWDDRRWTIGGSADDAGIGALDDKRVIAVNPAAWGDDLAAFFARYYPRTRYVAVVATTPAELAQKLRAIA
ncbi:MAG: hypothetical protein JXD18_03080 [Anaerolineae bacterium]|nr:hypothetical protein [Anaerolineae bacterium]